MGVEQRKSFVPWAILGAGLNFAAYGFTYGTTDNHPFELAMLNWLRDPTLYPNDPIREAFARFPTVFWRFLALLPQQTNIELVLFLFFVVTKLLFFYGLARITFWAESDWRLTRLVVVLLALSPISNVRTAFGAEFILDRVQTHTPLAVALLVCAGAWLLEGRWIAAAVLTAAVMYLSAPYTIYMLFAFVAFAVVDRSGKSTQILVAGALGALIVLPWVLHNRAYMNAAFPADYAQALLYFYPADFKLTLDNPLELLAASTFLAGVFGIVVWDHWKGIRPKIRLELMALCFVIPVMLGVIEGILLKPRFISWQLLRADTFLFFYASILLCVGVYRLACGNFLPFPRLVLPIAILLFAFPRGPLRFLLLIAGLQIALWSDFAKGFKVAQAWLAIHFVFRRQSEQTTWIGLVLVTAFLYIALLMAAWRDPRLTTQFHILDLAPSDWVSLQFWARSNTPREARFLVPTPQMGFRTFSLRSSWGEWPDGNIVYHDPAFAPEYLRRLAALNWNEPYVRRGETTDEMALRYKQLPWNSLLTIAAQNDLQYIVQYRPITYPGPMVYENGTFVVYKAGP